LDEDEENDSYESERKYAFRPSENYVDTDSPPASPEPYYVLDARTSRSRPSRLTQDESVLFTALEQEVRRTELWAPPGKLGVAIDVVNGHPVVHSLKAGSALEGFLSKGDRIVQIDEIDTSLMSAADVTSLMVRRMNDRRKIVYIRGDALG
jgi:C-terminal processing protease CtpA/Prc